MNFLIHKGKHSNQGLNVGIHLGKTRTRYKVLFGSNCIYDKINWENDWNKLCGFSYGILPWQKQITFTGARNIGDTEIFEWTAAHHKNSIRIGWRPSLWKQCVDLCLYIYEDNVLRISEDVIPISINMVYDINLSYKDGLIRLTAVNDKQTIEMKANFNPSIGYNMYPFFGGNEPAPHNINIHLKEI